MNKAAIAAVLVAAGIAGGVAAGSGRVVRVERAPSRDVFVPAGTFTMGVSEKDAEAAKEACIITLQTADRSYASKIQLPGGQLESVCDRYEEEMGEMRPRDVTLGAYAIDRDEVSVSDYRACVLAGGCSIDPLIDGDDRYIRDHWPLVNVTWYEARNYCRFHGGRLPTEAEWEHAARGNDERVWPWGNVDRPADFNHGRARDGALRTVDRGTPLDLIGDPDDRDGFAILAPTGSYPWGEGPFGTRDQAGNVAEWTADVRGFSDATLGYRDLSDIDPRREPSSTAPSESVSRVVRGGSWRQPPAFARANLRDPIMYPFMYLPTQRYTHVGFRCARSL